MKKQIFFPYWFHFLAALIFPLLCIALLVLEILLPIEDGSTLYWCLPLTVIMTIFMIIAMGYYMMQFTIITNDAIKVRCLWCTIRTLKWQDVKEVRYESINVSVQGGFTRGCYIFDDGITRKKIGNGSVLRKKANDITLPASKRAKIVIEEFWKSKIINKVTGS